MSNYIKIISFYNQNHPLFIDYKNFRDQLVPPSDEAETLEGEVLRAIDRLYYEFTNNGNCNAAEFIESTEEVTCWSCNGLGYEGEEEEDDSCAECDGAGVLDEEDGEFQIDEFYLQFINLIRKILPETEESLQGIEKVILQGYPTNMTWEQRSAAIKLYDSVMEKVVEWIDKKKGQYTPFEGYRKMGI